ncbi:DUF72 domain-containing protein [Streptomyces sp. NPDC046215]|uniref:DUF72 domain-containing protein n=1 Tax=Streptomyces stramineus TaxID=173861 RepID=A0ABP3KDA2_9ACTN
MATILVGTCSWTDPALLADGWYPPGARGPEGRLRYYATRFPVVEVDATYYGLPSARNSELWARRTPAEFTFDVKAFAPLTGHTVRARALPPDLRPPGCAPERRLARAELPGGVVDELWQRFTAALRPLRESGKLGSVLLQLPPWVRPGAGARAYLAECRARAPELPLAVEFRHPAWLEPGERQRTLDTLRAHRMASVATDTAQTVSGAMPPVSEVTCPDLAVVRFHGRSPSWGTGSKEDRFRHRYTEGELAPWTRRIQRLARLAEEVHVLFNNCCGDAAVSAASAMRRLLTATAGPEDTAVVRGGTPAAHGCVPSDASPRGPGQPTLF